MFKRKDVLIILWLTFITVVGWIGFSVYHVWVTSTIDSLDASAIVPITPTFDTETINKLKTRKAIEPLYKLNNGQSSPSATPTTSTLKEPTKILDAPQVTPVITMIPQASESP